MPMRRVVPREASPMEFASSRVKRCRYGWMLYSGAFKWDIPTSFELYGEYSEAEVACLRQLLNPGDTVLDIGANIGDLTVPMAQMVGDSGSVYAFEANRSNFNYLCADLALNDLANVRPINC
jgi:tRNA G37 N-methylase Trm5